MTRTSVWVLLEVEHEAQVDAEDYVSEVLENGDFQDAINGRAVDFGVRLRVTAALSDLDPQPLQKWFEEHRRVGATLGD